MHQDDRLKRLKAREGMKIGGLVNLGAGLGVMIFLHELLKGTAIYLCGMIPALLAWDSWSMFSSSRRRWSRNRWLGAGATVLQLRSRTPAPPRIPAV